jgi:hypothetical protein
MNPVIQENIPEKVNEQQNSPIVQEPQSKSTINPEQTPQIKSEENKANWKAFREQKEVERKAREAAEKRAIEKAAEAEALKAALEAAISNKTSNNRNQYDDDREISETEEERIDKRVKAILAEREIQSEKEKQERERQSLPDKMTQVYPDFNKVCKTENFDYLEYHHPVIYNALKNRGDSFESWSQIYQAIKQYVPNLDAKQDSQKAEKNLMKPQSISSPGNTQGGNAMPSARLDDARKAENWARMQRTLKGLS